MLAQLMSASNKELKDAIAIAQRAQNLSPMAYFLAQQASKDTAKDLNDKHVKEQLKEKTEAASLMRSDAAQAAAVNMAPAYQHPLDLERLPQKKPKVSNAVAYDDSGCVIL